MSNKYLLDTDIIIDLIKERYQLKSKIKSVGFSNCYVSEITLAELHFGAHYSSSVSKHTLEASQIANSFNIIPISEVLELFGVEKARLVKSGIAIPDFDILIALTAVQYDCILVTGNEKHHSRIAGIKIENWRMAKFNNFL